MPAYQSPASYRRLPEAGVPPELRLLDADRLAAVQRSQLLDTPAESSFDNLTALAARLLKVPAGFISIVEAQRDFYKSQHGFGQPLASQRQLTGRTLCHYTLDSDQPLVIDDTHAHPVWRGVPTVDTLGVRAYVGVPLTLDGENIGSFCVIDAAPREWQQDEVEILIELARSTSREIALRAALRRAQEDALTVRETVRAREELLAAVAHDLRIPLQALQLSISVMGSAAPARLPELVRGMEGTVSGMREIVGRMLASTGRTAGAAARPQPVALRTLLRDAAGMMDDIAMRTGVQLKLEAVADASVSGDFAMLLRAVGNVIADAVARAKPRTSVRLAATLQGASARIDVFASSGGNASQPPQPELEAARALIEQQGGTLQITTEADVTGWCIELPLR